MLKATAGSCWCSCFQIDSGISPSGSASPPPPRSSCRCLLCSSASGSLHVLSSFLTGRDRAGILFEMVFRTSLSSSPQPSSSSSSSSSSPPPPDEIMMSAPDCGSNRTGAGLGLERPEAPLCQTFSSTAVLVVLVAVIISIVVVSLLTFHFHKRRMKRRKMQRAQEEYERDTRSPKAAKAVKPVARQCVMVRPSAGPRAESMTVKDASPGGAAAWQDSTQDVESGSAS